MKLLVGIQYLRGAAALAVVCFHAAARLGLRFPIGEAGVDLFFVLSGFLMIAITTPASRPPGFLLDRIKRIVPAYWIVTSVFLAGALVGLFPQAMLGLDHIVASYLFLSVSLRPDGPIAPLVVPGWTLNLEMFFYAIFAMTLLMPRLVRLPALSVALGGLVVSGLLLHPANPTAQFYTQPILLEFLAGAWFGQYWKRYGAPPLGWTAIAAAAALYVLAWWLDAGNDWRVLLYGLPALLLFAGVLRIEHRGYLPDKPALRAVGDASYAIYLWHTLVLSVTTKVAHMLHLPIAAALLLGIVASLIGGVVAYRVIEKPINGWFRNRRQRLGVPIPSM